MKKIKGIALSLSEKAKHLLEIETGNHIANDSHKFMITLNLKTGLSKPQANMALARLLKVLKQEVFGRRSKKEIIQVIALENNKLGGYHAHILMENPYLRSEKNSNKSSENLQELIKKTWEKIPGSMKISLACPDGKSWFEEIYNKENAARYITKQITFNPDVIQWDLANTNGRRQM